MELVSFELAKKLKEKGFPQKTSGMFSMCGDCYYDDGRFYKGGAICNVNDAYTAPTISQVLKWLREEKKIMFEVPITLTDDGIWKFTFRIQTKEFYDRSNYEWDTYEKSALAGIEYVLNNLI